MKQKGKNSFICKQYNYMHKTQRFNIKNDRRDKQLFGADLIYKISSFARYNNVMNIKLEDKREENIQFVTSSKIICMLNNKCTGTM